VYASGNISVAVPFTETLEFVGGQRLVSERDYWVYVTAEDVEEIPNLQQKLEKIHIRTPDVTPPKFVGRWSENGTVSAVEGYAFDIVVQLDEAGPPRRQCSQHSPSPLPPPSHSVPVHTRLFRHLLVS